MFDYEIDFALDCSPAADWARLTRILADLSLDDLERVNEHVRQAVSRFYYFLSEKPGSAGRTAYSALVSAIKTVQIGREGDADSRSEIGSMTRGVYRHISL
jgi:hypothetical protein